MESLALIGEQKYARKILSALKEKKAVPNALIFTGHKGVGKADTALFFAMLCNCLKGFSLPNSANRENPAKICDCPSCRKILNSSHPDITFLKPSGKIIKIDEVRKLAAGLSLKPYEAKQRFIIINEADKLNIEASNAILKEIEEPPANSTFILIADNTEALLPTIVSRCRQIRFSPISEEQISFMLTKYYGVEKKKAQIVAAMSEGSFFKAKRFIDEKWSKMRLFLLNELADMSEASVLKLLSLAEMINENKKMIEAFWEIIKNFIRDLALYPFYSENLINKDFEKKIAKIVKISKKADIQKLYEDFFMIEAIENKMRFNINLRLALENALLKIYYLTK